MVLSEYRIAELTASNGWLGIGPLPGRGGFYDGDLNAILRWGADVVLTMTTTNELARGNAETFGADLNAADVEWRHLPVADFGVPPADILDQWPKVSEDCRTVLARGGRVFAHCFGGCGRSGMVLMRLMVEMGEDAGPALERLRGVRPCAVETEDQKAWASAPMYDRLGWAQ